jgi:hypothetical protein
MSFCSVGALEDGRTLRSAVVPAVVGRSRVLMLSLTTIGSPASSGSVAPALRIASILRAASRAPALFSVISALRSASASARASSVLTYISADRLPSRMASSACDAVSSLCSAAVGPCEPPPQPLNVPPIRPVAANAVEVVRNFLRVMWVFMPALRGDVPSR